MTWEVGPREMMRRLHTDNITINIMNRYNTAMFIVDQGTSLVIAQRHLHQEEPTEPVKVKREVIFCFVEKTARDCEQKDRNGSKVTAL